MIPDLNTYLTVYKDDAGRSFDGPHIHSRTIEEAEGVLKALIDKMLVPPNTEIYGTLFESIDLVDAGDL